MGQFRGYIQRTLSNPITATVVALITLLVAVLSFFAPEFRQWAGLNDVERKEVRITTDTQIYIPSESSWVNVDIPAARTPEELRCTAQITGVRDFQAIPDKDCTKINIKAPAKFVVDGKQKDKGTATLYLQIQDLKGNLSKDIEWPFRVYLAPE